MLEVVPFCKPQAKSISIAFSYLTVHPWRSNSIAGFPWKQITAPDDFAPSHRESVQSWNFPSLPTCHHFSQKLILYRFYGSNWLFSGAYWQLMAPDLLISTPSFLPLSGSNGKVQWPNHHLNFSEEEAVLCSAFSETATGFVPPLTFLTLCSLPGGAQISCCSCWLRGKPWSAVPSLKDFRNVTLMFSCVLKVYPCAA